MIKRVTVRYSVEYETDVEIIIPDNVKPNFTTEGRPMLYNQICAANNYLFDIVAPENNNNNILHDSIKILEIWD
jgi:hypothetical protein